MTLQVIRLHSLAEATPFWSDLAEADTDATFFSTPAWLETWWAHHQRHRELLLLVLQSPDAVVAFAPLQIDLLPWFGGRRVTLLGAGLSDYSAILVDERAVNRQYAVHALLDQATSLVRGAVFDFEQLPQHSKTLAAIQEWARHRQAEVTTMNQDVCPIARLPDTPEQYHQYLKKSFLADLRRGERRLRERGTVRLVDHIRPEDGDWTALRDQMAGLQSQRMMSKGQIPAWQGKLGAFVKEILQNADKHGRLRITGLYLDDELIAYELCFLHRETIYAWSRAFHEAYKSCGPGKIALLHLIETACLQRFHIFDLLRGEEPYKELWTNESIQNKRILFVVKPSLPAFFWYKYISSWRGRIKQMGWLRKMYRLLKALKGG